MALKQRKFSESQLAQLASINADHQLQTTAPVHVNKKRGSFVIEEIPQKQTIDDAELPSNSMRHAKSKRNTKKRESSIESRSRSTGGAAIFFDFTEVFVWGDDTHGQLGLYHQKLKKGYSSIKSFKVPKTCSFNILIKQVSCGENHAAILTSSGHLYMMGNNSHGQLGIAENCLEGFQNVNKDCAPAPCLVDTLRDLKICKVSCGSNFTIALIDSQSQFDLNTIYTWGNNEFGQLGLNSEQQCESAPRKVTCFQEQGINITSISGGRDHSLFLSNSGQVYGCGSNAQGQLGIATVNIAGPGFNDSQNFPQLAYNTCQQIDSLQGLNITQISAGHAHSLFLNDRGEVFATGCNQKYQLGICEIINSTAEPIKVQALAKHRVTKIDAKSNSAAVTATGELFLWGVGVYGSYKSPQKIVTINSQVVDVCLGGATLGAAIDSKGLVWTWGSNINGELGIGDTESKTHPYPVIALKKKAVTQVACGGSFIVALGSNMKKEIPGLKLGLKKAASQSRRHRRNQDVTSQSVASGSGVIQKSAHSVERNKSSQLNISSASRSNKKRSKSFQRIIKTKENCFSHQNQNGLVIGNGALNRSPMNICFGPDDNQVMSKNEGRGSNFELIKKKQPSTSADEEVSTNQQLLNQSDFMAINHVSINAEPMYPSNHTQSQPNLNKSVNSSQHQTLSLKQIQNSLHAKKEQHLKDLSSENKSIRTENELLKKDNRLMSSQLESFEKQSEKQRQAMMQQNAGELQRVYDEVKRRETEIVALKAKKKVRKQKLAAAESMLEQFRADKVQVTLERDQLAKQLQDSHFDINRLAIELSVAEQKKGQWETQIKDNEVKMTLLKEHNRKVEQDLLQKVQEYSEKHKQSQIERDSCQLSLKEQSKRVSDLQNQIRESTLYTSAVEKENQFLREEIERTKYSKDKEQYGQFLSGLVKVKNYVKPATVELKEQSPAMTPALSSPLQEITLQRQNTSSAVYRTTDVKEETKKGKVEPVKQENQENEDRDTEQRKLQYNQRLLKSLERKTLTKYR